MKTSAVLKFLGLAFSIPTTAAQNSSSHGAAICCNKLGAAFTQETFTNTGDQSIGYGTILHSYLSETTRLSPNCFIQPDSPQQVSKIVSILSQGQCEFAVKGGGGLLVVGSNDIENGVTVDLAQLKNITLGADNTTAVIGAGAKWGDVYEVLGPQGYAVAGAQATNVGVSGFTLGGGFTFYNTLYGWGFDSVKNFEIVLGNGTLTNANPQQNSDLFKALKGGLGNLGIVTRFEYTTFKDEPLWGGVAAYNFSDIEKFYGPVVEFVNNNAREPNGSIVFSYTSNATSGATDIGIAYDYVGNATAQHYYTHTDPPGTTNKYPSPFTGLQNVSTPTSNTLRVDSLYNIAYELNSPSNNSRLLLADLLFKSDTEVLTKVDRIVRSSLQPYFDNRLPKPYTEAQVLYQRVPRIVNDISVQKHGGNVLGLERVPDNSINLLLLIFWEDPSKDAFLQRFSDEILSNVTTYLKSVPGGFRDWQYGGESSADQDVIGSYGQANVEYLKAVSKKYDPGQVFQRLVPGGWKLGDAGRRNRGFNFNQFGS